MVLGESKTPGYLLQWNIIIQLRLSEPHHERKTMKNNLIDIVERFQMHHALQEERELKNSNAPGNGAVAPGAPDKNGIPENTLFECDEMRISTVTLPGGTEWTPPHDGWERLVVRLGEIGHPFSKDSEPAFPARWTWIPANSDFKVANGSDETRNLMIVAFHDVDREQLSPIS